MGKKVGFTSIYAESMKSDLPGLSGISTILEMFARLYYIVQQFHFQLLKVQINQHPHSGICDSVYHKISSQYWPSSGSWQYLGFSVELCIQFLSNFSHLEYIRTHIAGFVRVSLIDQNTKFLSMSYSILYVLNYFKGAYWVCISSFNRNNQHQLTPPTCRIYASVNWVNIGSDNGLSPGRRQAIIWINAAILWIGPLGTNFSEILIDIRTLSFKEMHLKMAAAKWRPFCPGRDELNNSWHYNSLTEMYIMTELK